MFSQATLFNVEDIVGAFTLFKSEAHKSLRTGNYLHAIENYSTALQLRPDDRTCLVRRSKCHLMLGDTARALQDAEASLLEDKTYHRGMFQKAEALYNAGDFEMALVYYHRGNRLRPELLEFRLGIQRAQEAIINCVGTPDRVKLNTTGDLSFFNAQDEKKKRKVFGSACVKRPLQVVRRQREKTNNEMTIKQMLGDLYGDRQYLEKLLKETDNTTLTGKHINRLVQEGLSYLDTRTEFWQQVKPMYARKYEAILALNRGRTVKTSPYDHIVCELEKINKLMNEGNYEGVLKKSQRVMGTLDNIQEVHLPNKMTFKANIYSIMGNAYLEMGDFANAAIQHQMDLTIGEEVGIDDAECRALDNLGRVHARNGKYKKAIDVWERKLPKSKGPLESTWLCHEIGRCYLELGESRSAKEYGERALLSAEEALDDRWRLHALVLISQAEVKSERLASALINFEKAFEVAGLLMDNEAQATIKKAIADVNLKVIERELESGEEVDPGLLADLLDTKSVVMESHKEEHASNAVTEPHAEDADAKSLSTQQPPSAEADFTGKS